MKKMVVLFFVLVSMTACNANVSENAKYEAAFREEYLQRLANSPAELAKFLSMTGELREFVSSDSGSPEDVKEATEIFVNDENVHQEALARAEALLSEVHIDSNWEELGKVYPEAPLAITETGEPISTFAGPWDGPAD